MDMLLDAEDLFEDELHDYFEEEAYEEWRIEDAHRDPSDPYEQRGLRHEDFY
jgi:hypothetical protein